MQELEKLNLVDDELTVALRKLRPAVTKQSARDVWYQAGYQSGRRSVNLWRGAVAGLGAVCIGLLVAMHQPAGDLVSRSAYVRNESTQPASQRSLPIDTDAESSDFANLRNSLIADDFRHRSVAPPTGHGVVQALLRMFVAPATTFVRTDFFVQP